MLTESISSSNCNPSHFGLLRYTDIHFTNDSDDFYNQVCLLQIELHIAFALLRSVTALENLHDFLTCKTKANGDLVTRASSCLTFYRIAQAQFNTTKITIRT